MLREKTKGKETMKKMMILFAAFTMITNVYAANLNWSTSGFRVQGSTTTLVPIAGANDMYYQLVFTTDAAGSVGDYTYAGGLGVNDKSVVSKYYTRNGGLSLEVAGDDAAVKSWTGSPVLTTANFYLVAFYNGTGDSLASPTHWYVSNIQQIDVSNLAGADASMAFSGNSGAATLTPWVAVPEPTSMALLALGVAAVGLRRRFRK